MTLLTICQQVAEEVGGLNVPNTIVGNNDESAVRLLALAKREGNMLAKHDWPVLIKEATFSTSDGTASYTLSSVASDFDRFVPVTAWNTTDSRFVPGAISMQRWQNRQHAIATSNQNDQLFAVFASSGKNAIYIDPTPTGAETISFIYVSNQWAESSGGTAQTTWQADSDVARIDEDLIELGVKWRLLNALGLPFATEREEYEMEVMKRLEGVKPAPKLNMSQRSSAFVFNVPNSDFPSS